MLKNVSIFCGKGLCIWRCWNSIYLLDGFKMLKPVEYIAPRKPSADRQRAVGQTNFQYMFSLNDHEWPILTNNWIGIHWLEKPYRLDSNYYNSYIVFIFPLFDVPIYCLVQSSHLGPRWCWTLQPKCCSTAAVCRKLWRSPGTRRRCSTFGRWKGPGMAVS